MIDEHEKRRDLLHFVPMQQIRFLLNDICLIFFAHEIANEEGG